MLWCLVLLGALLTRKSTGFRLFPGERMERLFGSDFEDIGLPGALRDDFTEKSFAGRSQNDIRLPFGANPQVKHIENFRFFNNDRFRYNYQANLHTAWIENQDWRLDPTTNGPLTQYSKPHNPEDSYGKIDKFCRKRASQRAGLSPPVCSDYFN